MIWLVRLQTWCFGSKGRNNPRLSFSSIRWARWLLTICTPYIPPPPYLVWVTFSFKKVVLGYFVAQRCVTVLVLDVSSVDTQHISSTPILGLCHGFFTNQFIFRHILGHFFPRKENLYHNYERIRSIRYQKEKLNVIKRQKISFLGRPITEIRCFGSKRQSNPRFSFSSCN